MAIIIDKRFIIVSNRLPFLRTMNGNGEYYWEEGTGGLVTAMDPILRKCGGIWLGWDGISNDALLRRDFNLIDVNTIKIKKKLYKKSEGSYCIGCIPINSEEIEEYYNKFSNGTLWSLFHYFFEKSFIDYSSWKTYCRVNKRFADYIHNVAEKDDIIWVQDYHLFMVPYFLRRLRPEQPIHFFLHIPFPHIDIYSILPWQRQILESLLCCNTVGFHHRRYLRNFQEAVDLFQKEKITYSQKYSNGIKEKINPTFYVNPISIDFEKFDQTSRKAEVISLKNEIIRRCNSPKIILGVDRLDYSKGIKVRLLGLELFLEEHPEYRETFAYYQLAIPSRKQVEAYQLLKKEIDEIVGRINGRFSTETWAPIHYIYNTAPFDELIALYSAADICLVTPLRDGMNLVCKEYIASHSDNKGILILSKFAGATAEIKNSLVVNPYSIEDISNVLLTALTMPENEIKPRMVKMRRNVRLNNIQTWLNKSLKIFEESQNDFKNCRRNFIPAGLEAISSA